jgi:hypothetical protein
MSGRSPAPDRPHVRTLPEHRSARVTSLRHGTRWRLRCDRPCSSATRAAPCMPGHRTPPWRLITCIRSFPRPPGSPRQSGNDARRTVSPSGRCPGRRCPRLGPAARQASPYFPEPPGRGLSQGAGEHRGPSPSSEWATLEVHAASRRSFPFPGPPTRPDAVRHRESEGSVPGCNAQVSVGGQRPAGISGSSTTNPPGNGNHP